ncbi:MAG: hypothetical protein E7565_07800 [Ruminococcaceae bacterium]|nr:hypothetical protein [Oscillospiraceae bacterium]
MKKVIAVLMCICFVFTLCGCTFLKDVADSAGIEKPKVFEYEGVSIELTTDFFRMDDLLSEDYDFVIGDGDVTVMGVKAVLDDAGQTTPDEFAELYRSVISQQNPTEVTELDGIPTFQFVMKENEEDDLKVAVMFYKGSGPIWVVTFATDVEDFNEHYEDICKFAKTVKCE